MFKKLYKLEKDIRRHQNAPFAQERLSILQRLEKQSYSMSTITSYAKILLCLSNLIQKLPEETKFYRHEIDGFCKQHFPKIKSCALYKKCMTRILEELDKIKKFEKIQDKTLAQALNDFIDFKKYNSNETLDSYRVRITDFALFLAQRNIEFSTLTVDDVDEYLLSKEHLKPISKRVVISILINFLRFCEEKSFIEECVSPGIVRPRVWQYDTIPSALPWNIVEKIRNDCETPKCSYRNKAVLLLLSTYGFRIGEITNLTFNNIDWEGSILSVIHYKTYQLSKYPLDTAVGNALMDYIKRERPPSESKYVFLTAYPPYKKLSRSGLSKGTRRLVLKHTAGLHSKKGPHAIRHAVAQHLLDMNMSYKVIGDQLGHKRQESTQIYAKLDRKSLSAAMTPTVLELLDYKGLNSRITDGIALTVLRNVMTQTLEEIL